jgi:beta-carotene hydroxylase
MLSKYRFNQFIFGLSLAILALIYSLILYFRFPLWTFPFLLPVLAFFLHYQYNIVHIASHGQVSRNRILNSFIGNFAAIIGATTLASFTANHLEHHKDPTNPKVDPDDAIVSETHLLLIPFKILYQDMFFWRSRLWRKRGLWKGYMLDRAIQILILLILFFSGSMSYFLIFWALPVWLLGTLNGLFLFYFPHYSTKRVDNWENLKKPNLLVQLLLGLIFISRFYHTKHHLKPSQNSNYYPVFSFLRDSLEAKLGFKIVPNV